MGTLWKNLQARYAPINWGQVFGLVFFIVVVAALFSGVGRIKAHLVANEDSHFSRLTVLGEPVHTAEADIVRAIKKADLSSFFDLDVLQVQQAVTALPWVASASVRKQWPDTLQVYVVEHQAVAHWNGDFLLNQAGDVFQAKSPHLAKDLPTLYGPEGSELEAWQTFQEFNELLYINGFGLKSLALSERFAWQLWLDNGIRLNLGREEKVKRVQRFIDLYPYIGKRNKGPIDAVDLRYDIGLAVSFKPQPDAQHKDNKSEA